MSEKKPNSDELTVKQELAIAGLLSCRTIGEAAKCCKVSSRQLSRWFKQPAFESAFRLARRQAFSQIIGRLSSVSINAVDVLGEAVKKANKGISPSTQINAARIILEQLKGGIELDDLAERLNRLESLMNELESKNKATRR